MASIDTKKFKYTWEEAIDLLRNDPEHKQLIFDAYLTKDLVENSNRFAKSDEFSEVLRLIKMYAPNAKDVLDMPGGNGIATYAFSKEGFKTTAVEPDNSDDVGRGAIEYVLSQAGLKAEVIDAWGEDLPFENASFDVVYIRQGLHHASNLEKMVSELGRILRPGGLLIACREHVVDDYGKSLEAFLLSQVDHQLYGGEHAFLLSDYRNAILKADFDIKREIKPFESIINIFPSTFENLENQILSSIPGRILNSFLPKSLVIKLGLWRLNRKRIPGRLYSFIATKK